MGIIIDHQRFETAHRAFEAFLLEKSGVPFTNFQHPFLIDDEISYKWRVYRDAKDALNLQKWANWRQKTGKIIQAVKDACHPKVSANILEHRYGLANSSEAALYRVSDSSEIIGLEKYLYHFFLQGSYAPEEFSLRFDALAEYLRENRLGCNWAFLSYLAFLYYPQMYFPIRPSRFDALLKYYGVGKRITRFVNWQHYAILLELADVLRSKLSVYGMPDAIEIQSYMWVVSYLIDELKETQDVTTPNFEAELESRIKQAKERERIGLLGERFVYEQEVLKLESHRRVDLARKVQIVSFTGDYPYDILSFTVEGNELHIEVKTTTRIPEQDNGFWLSENERTQAATDVQWVIYRVWSIDTSPTYKNLGNIVLQSPPGWTIQPSGWYVKRDVK